MDMNTFNSNNFIKSLKEGYDAIPVHQGNSAAKVLVADSIKANGYNPQDVLPFILDKMGVSSTRSEEEWKQIIKTAIKNGGFLGDSLKEYKSSLKGKLSYEEMFKLAASCCGLPSELISQEFCLNQVNWERVIETLIKTPVVGKAEKKVATSVVKPTTIKEAKKKTSIKTSKSTKRDPRSKSITLVNEKTGAVKTWHSYRACEKELYGDPKKGHGTVCQLLDPKKGLKHLPGGWALPKADSPSVKAPKLSTKRSVIQLKKDKRGRLKVVNTFSSITEASKATGIPHCGISKVLSGTYQSTGGYVWKAGESVA